MCIYRTLLAQPKKKPLSVDSGRRMTLVELLRNSVEMQMGGLGRKMEWWWVSVDAIATMRE